LAAALIMLGLSLGVPGTAPHLLADDRPASTPVDFSREILPILSDACFHCHGPAETGRKADLRLDVKDGLFANRGDYLIVAAGKPEESELVSRVLDTDPASVMPPPNAARQLKPSERELLKRWVSEGAPWGVHWAFAPMTKPAVPVVKHKDRVRSPIDAFVLSRLEREGIEPAPEAPREAWLRRVTFDLTGLPPTLDELDAFLADNSDDAYGKVVDRLFASPRYGERMATEWLDVARYADTHGYQMDRFRPVHPWRDWVISAFQRNLPFDDFVRWQLAGDLLPNATKEQYLATAFNRLHMQNEEGGIVEEEFRVAYVVDRVNTMGTAFLGMTFECSRCHDHKYDPISQKDFYSLYAFFQNIDEFGQTTYFTSSTPVPTLLLTSNEQDAQLASLRSEIARTEQALTTARQEAEPAFTTWLADFKQLPDFEPPVARFTFDAAEGGKVVNTVTADQSLGLVEGPKFGGGKLDQAAELEGDNGFSGPATLGTFSRTDPFSISVWLKPGPKSPRQVILHKSIAPADAGSRGYELLLEEGRLSIGLHHMWPGNSLKRTSVAELPVGEWSHVTVTYDGSSRAAGLKLYVAGRLTESTIVRDKLTKDITYEGGPPAFQIGYRFRDNGYKGGAIDELRLYGRELLAPEVADLGGHEGWAAFWSKEPATLTPEEKAARFDWFTSRIHEPTKQARAALAAARVAESKFVNPIPEMMVMRELESPKPAYVLKRGAYDAPGDAVTANTPGAMPPFPNHLPKNRLGLAKWLLDPEHPLTARVTVNRLWQMLFGKGLVETSDNFGSQGSLPTHPELLDWLARDFIASGWDQQRFLKQIVLSSTYRQSSRASTDLLARDPLNQFLGRGPGRRLTAEQLRDQSLFLSGLLVEKVGGPSVKPYQPDGIWSVAMGSPRYDQGKGEDLYRRSLYTFWKRTVPPPAMVAFDAAERNVCIVKRQSTSTPLQALALMNDPQIVEAARFFGQRLLKHPDTNDATRLTWLFRSATSRAPRERELAILLDLWRGQREWYKAHPADAKKLLETGEAKPDPSLDPTDLAAACVLAQAVLNFDECVMAR
jgi:hypothetical protein